MLIPGFQGCDPSDAAVSLGCDPSDAAVSLDMFRPTNKNNSKIKKQIVTSKIKS